MSAVSEDRQTITTDPPTTPEKPSAKQSCILEAAASVFLREGYERASVDAIAAEADVSKRTIYNHFTDKRGLFIAVIGHKLNYAHLAAALAPENLHSPESIRADLTELGHRTVDQELDEEIASLRRVLISDMNQFPEVKLACKQMFLWDAVRLLANRLHELFPDQLTPELAETALTQYLGIIVSQAQALSAYWAVPVPQETRDRFIGDAVDLIIRAYRLE